MNVQDIIVFITTIPDTAWLIIVLFIITWSKTLFPSSVKKWGYEVDFPLTKGIGSGKVEIECYEKRGASIRLRLNIEPLYQKREIQVFISDQLTLTVPAEKNKFQYLKFRQKYLLPEPKEKEVVQVIINKTIIHTGILIYD